MAHLDDATAEFVESYIKNLIDRQATATATTTDSVSSDDGPARRVADERFTPEMKLRFEGLRDLARDRERPQIRSPRRFRACAVLSLLLFCAPLLTVAHGPASERGAMRSLWQDASQNVLHRSRAAFEGMESAAVFVSKRICDWCHNLGRDDVARESNSVRTGAIIASDEIPPATAPTAGVG